MPQTDVSASLPEICAPREDVLYLLDRYARKQFIYMHAPSGYGKTVVAQLWINKAHRSAAWLFLDQYDNHPALFYRSMCRSLLTTAQSAWEDRPEFLQNSELSKLIGSPGFSAAPVECAMEFISMLIWQDEPYALILDDLHHITNEEILRSLPYVLKRLPKNINVLFLSRTPLPAAMADIINNQQIEFVVPGDLTFTSEEIRRLFNSHGQFVSMKRAADIHGKTGGWAIILNAMLLSGNPSLSYDNSKPALDKFFRDHIWDYYDEATQMFLMKTSVVDSFTPELCLALTENPENARILDMLSRGNVNLALNGDEYRYHDLFLEFLREQARESGIRRDDLLITAAEYYLQTGEYYKAASYALRSGNAEIDMRIIQCFFNSTRPTLDQYYELARVYDISHMPEDHCAKQPILYMPNILSAILIGDVDKAWRLFDHFYAALPEFVKLKHPIADVAVTRLILDARVKLADLPAFLESLGLKRDGKVPGQTALVTMQMPFPHRSNRDYTEFLDRSVMDALRDLLFHLLGDDNACFLACVSAGLLMEQNKLDEALHCALRAYQSLTEYTSGELYFGASILLAEIYGLTSAAAESRSVLERLHQWIEKNEAPYLIRNLTAYETRLSLWDRDLSAARGWLNNYYIGSNAVGEFYRIAQDYTTARAYIVLSEPEMALTILKQLAKLSDAMDRPLDKAEAEVLAAIAEWIAGQRKKARDRLSQLLAALRPYGYIRIVANEGKSILPILTGLIKEMERAADKDESLYRFAKEIYAAASEQSKHHTGMTHGSRIHGVRLSPKQTYVLELLSKGHSQAEITRITGRSINTVREHTKAAYKKLEVNNAADAVAKAKELKLIE